MEGPALAQDFFLLWGAWKKGWVLPVALSFQSFVRDSNDWLQAICILLYYYYT